MNDVEQKRKKAKPKRTSNPKLGRSASRRPQPLDRVVMYCDDLPTHNGYSSSEYSEVANGCETDRSNVYLGSFYSVRSELELKEM